MSLDPFGLQSAALSPRPNLSKVFNATKARCGIPVASRPQSAVLVHGKGSARGMLTGDGKSPRGLGIRSLNDANADFTDWMMRQTAIRDMLGGAKAQAVTLMPRASSARKHSATAQARNPPTAQGELPHERVWREAASRRMKISALKQAREEEARAAAEAFSLEQASRPLSARKLSVDPRELIKVQRRLQEWFLDDNKRFRKIYRAMDEDKNGWVDRRELHALPALTNLHYMLPLPLLDALIDLMDLDGDGRILYQEFVRVIMADDVFNP